MKEYVKNTEKYVENMKEYEEISRYFGFDTVISIWTLELEKIPISPPLSMPWEKFQALPLYRLIYALGLGKFPHPSFILGSGWKNYEHCLFKGSRI